MGIFIPILGNLVIQALGYLLNRPRPPRAEHALPEKLGGVVAEEGRALPLLWGTRAIKAPNLGWFGDTSQTSFGSRPDYNYFMGSKLNFCIGPVDAFPEVRFNDRQVGVGISSSSNQIVFDQGGSPATAVIPPASYSSGATLAAAIEAAMIAALSGNWRVTFGFKIVAGVNDQLKFQIDTGTVYTVVLTPGDYTGATLASHISSKLNASTGVPAGNSFSCGYNGATFKFTITLDTIPLPGGPWSWTTWTLKPSNGKSTIGFRHDIDHVSTTPIVSLTGGFAVKVNRFTFSYGGTTGKLRCTDGAFTAATVLGISTAADKSGLGIGISDTDFTVIEATFTDQGDFLQVDINDPDFFGTEGGVVGRLDLYYGKDTQAASSYLTTQFGTPASGFPLQCYGVQRHMNVGATNYPKPIAVVAQRFPNQLGLPSGQHIIGQDANPACMLYELYTNLEWGLQTPSAQMNAQSLIDMGAALAAEGLGMSWLIDEPVEADEIVKDILRHVDAARYEDPYTGLITFRLIRGDYNRASLPVVSKKNARELRRAAPQPDLSRNVVRVKFIDKDRGHTENTLQIQDLANIQARGGEQDVEEYRFPGLSSEGSARKVANRLIRQVANPPREMTLEVNRELWALRVGSPFRFVWPEQGISDTVGRVTRVSPGLLEDGWIAIEVTEDPYEPIQAGYGLVYGEYYGGS